MAKSTYPLMAEKLADMLIAWQQDLLTRFVSRCELTHAYSQHIFYELQQRLRPAVSLEIGAREASFSREMRRRSPEITVAAFEASPLTFAHFSKNTPFEQENIQYHNMAVSDTDGPVNFNLVLESDFLSGRNSLHSRADLPSHQIEVQAVRGDTILQNWPEAEISLWIDVEGAAEQVLKGFIQGFRSRRIASVFIEVEEYDIWKGQWTAAEVKRFFLEQEYLPVFCDAEYYRTLRKGDMVVSQYNIIFCRQEDVNQDLLYFIVENFEECAKALHAANTR